MTDKNTAILKLGYRFLEKWGPSCSNPAMRNRDESVPSGLHGDGPQAQQYAGQQSMHGEEGGPGSGRRPYGYARQRNQRLPSRANPNPVSSTTVPSTRLPGDTVPGFDEESAPRKSEMESLTMNTNQQRRGPGSGPVGTVGGGTVRFDQPALGQSAIGGEYGHTAGGDSMMEGAPKQMAMCPMTKTDEEASTKHNPTDCHTRLSVSLGNRPLPEGQQKLQQAGYVMDSAQGELGSTLDYKYRHPDGHEITLSSVDGQNTTGIKYQFKPPKPQVMGTGQRPDMPRPPIGNIFAQNAQQRPSGAQQPQQPGSGKPGLGIFRPPKDATQRPQIGPQPGGSPKGEAPNTFAPGSTQPQLGPQAQRQDEGGPGSGRRPTGRTKPRSGTSAQAFTYGARAATSDSPQDPYRAKTEMRAYVGGQAPVTGQGRKMFKGVPMGPFEQMSGPGVFCDMCHVATSINSTVNYKGMRICKNRCWTKYGPLAK